MFHSSTLSRRARGVLLGSLAAATVTLFVPAVANAAGYPTNLPHYESIAYVRATLSGGGYVGFDLRTNPQGQINRAIVGVSHLPSVICPGQMPFYLDTNGLTQILSNHGSELSPVGVAGSFSFKQTFETSPYTMTVTGRVTARGNHVSGTVTVVSATPGIVNGVSGCTDPTAHSTYSAKPHFQKF
jgi:hypothetical protein